MGVLTLSKEFAIQLRDAKDITVLRDDSGAPVGMFRPILPGAADANGKKDLTSREVFELFLSLTSDDETRAHLSKIIDKVKERDACATR